MTQRPVAVHSLWGRFVMVADVVIGGVAFGWLATMLWRGDPIDVWMGAVALVAVVSFTSAARRWLAWCALRRIVLDFGCGTKGCSFAVARRRGFPLDFCPNCGKGWLKPKAGLGDARCPKHDLCLHRPGGSGPPTCSLCQQEALPARTWRGS